MYHIHMATITVTYNKRLPICEGGPEALCEVSSTSWLAGLSPNELAARLEAVRIDYPQPRVKAFQSRFRLWDCNEFVR